MTVAVSNRICRHLNHGSRIGPCGSNCSSKCCATSWSLGHVKFRFGPYQRLQTKPCRSLVAKRSLPHWTIPCESSGASLFRMHSCLMRLLHYRLTHARCSAALQSTQRQNCLALAGQGHEHRGHSMARHYHGTPREPAPRIPEYAIHSSVGETGDGVAGCSPVQFLETQP